MPAQPRSLSIPLFPRDATASKDARLTNCYIEKGPMGSVVVKRPGMTVAAALGIGQGQGATTFNGEALFIKSDILNSDIQPFATGSSWTTSTAPPRPTNGDSGTTRPGSMVSMGGNLYHIGGRNNLDSDIAIYKSTDNGTSWTTILAIAPFNFLNPRQSAVALGGRIYVLLATKAIWSSANGVTWINNTTNVTGDATHDPTELIVHGSLLYAFFQRSTGAIKVFSSADGTAWSSVNGAVAGIGNRTYFSVASLSGNLYIIGGLSDATPVMNDVWKSTNNGATWALATAAAAFAARQFSMVVTYNSKMWLLGGSTSTTLTAVDDDVYSSTDGITWALVTAAAGWSARRSASIAVHNDTIYIGPGIGSVSNAAVSSMHFAALGGATATSLPTPTQSNLPIQVALIPANGATVAKAFIKSTKDAWVWDGTTITKVTDVDYPATTVYGVAYLDGTIYVIDANGVIYGSDLLLPLSWNALNFISAISEADAGVAIARQLDNIIAFKETSIEFFYDAANPTGSPLSKQPNALLEIGCATAASLAYSDNTLFFMSQHKQRGRSVMKFDGMTPKQVSAPWVDRILDGDDLATIYAFVVRLNGHIFYFLTLKSSAITLVYDDISGEWSTATKMTALTAVTVSTIAVQADGSILVTMTLAHGQSDGDPVLIAGATPTGANGLFNLRYDTAIHSAMQFSYVPATAVAGSITGTVTATFYQSSYFPGSYYARSSTADLVLDEATGNIYEFSTTVYQDVGAPVDMHIRTEREDFGTIVPKAYNALSIIADAASGNLAVRYTNNDYSTFSKYRLVDLSKERPRLTQLGSASRRAWEFRYTANTPLRLSSVEPDVQSWER